MSRPSNEVETYDSLESFMIAYPGVYPDLNTTPVVLCTYWYRNSRENLCNILYRPTIRVSPFSWKKQTEGDAPIYVSLIPLPDGKFAIFEFQEKVVDPVLVIGREVDQETFVKTSLQEYIRLGGLHSIKFCVYKPILVENDFMNMLLDSYETN